MIVRCLLFLAAVLLVLAVRPGWAQPGPVESEWTKYRDRFVTADGRVRDTGNKEVSHTEGQGWAMLFAEEAGDRAAFAKLWQWTRDNLQRRDNALFSWRFDPADGKTPVADLNDASDGDILIAWALIRAGNRWGEAEYKEAAKRVVSDIRHRLLSSTPGRLVLLPGAAGFKSKDGLTVVNPSYYVYPALKEFAKFQPSPQWQRLRRDGLALLAEARFGRWGLTPDWIDLDKKGGVEPASKFPARFGFDAAVTDNVKATFQLASGDSNDPRSTNQSFGNSATKKSIWIDQAYIDWKLPYLAGSDVLLEQEYYSVGGGFIEWKGYTPPKKNQPKYPFATMKELRQHAEQNKISIATGIIDFYSKGKSRIRYKLEKDGAADDWQYAPDYYTIRYEGLQPGKYRLVIQASNSTNEFNGPAKVLQIIISPPFWQTWWFKTLVVIILIALIYSIVQYRSRNLKKRNVELEGKVMHRTKELKHSLEDLRATQAQLIQQEKMASLGELTAGIAHEIQNPLNFVNNFSDLNKELADELEQEIHKGNYDDARTIAKDIKENEEKINRHGKRAGAIVKGMLQHSRTSSGQRELTDLNKLADEYLRLTYHGLRAKDKSFDAKIETDFDSSVDKINVVPQDIGRVIVNLINNAFYAVGERQKAEGLGYKPLVIVSTKKLNDKVEIKVKDNGNGIPQKILDKIFQPFFTTKPTGQGTGLGLSLAYDIVKTFGGEIKVETKKGEGASFIIVL